MEKLELQAYAKVNLALKVTGRDARGYHLLDGLMLSVDLADRLSFTRREDRQLVLSCPAWLESGEGNTVMRAAALLRERYPYIGADITLEKNIPVRAGMGGGSADAAAALRGLIKLWELDVSAQDMAALALTVGADVPFALHGGLARAKGVGETLEPIDFRPSCAIVCAKAEAGLSTPEVFRAWDALESDAHVDVENFLRALQHEDWAGVRQYGGNDLYQAAAYLSPPIRGLLERMEALGAEYAVMTGSGAAVIALFPLEEAARDAVEALEAEGYFAAVTHATAQGVL